MNKTFRILVVAGLALSVVVGTGWLMFALGDKLNVPPQIFVVPLAILVSWLGVPWLIRLTCWAFGMSRAETQKVMDRDSGRGSR